MRYFLLILAFITLYIFSCTDGDFVTSFNEIENYKLRPVSLQLLNSELMPSDTVVFEGYFAGADLKPNYTCSIGFNYTVVAVNGPPSEVVSGIEPYEKYRIDNPNYPDSITTNYMRFSFIIPDSIFYTSTSIPEKPLTVLDDKMWKDFPDSIKNMTKNEFIDFSYIFLSKNFSTASNKEIQMAAIIVQALTIQIKIKIETEDNYKMEKNVTVRLNKSVKNNPLVMINKNPTNKWLGVYTVKEKDLSEFDPNTYSGDYSFFYIYKDSSINDNRPLDSIITLNDNYSYFVAVDSGVVNGVDYRDYGIWGGVSPMQEYWDCRWFFQQDASEIENVANKDQANFTTGSYTTSTIIKLYPPKNKKITHIDFWVKTYDVMIGERLRPKSGVVRSGRLYFK